MTGEVAELPQYKETMARLQAAKHVSEEGTE